MLDILYLDDYLAIVNKPSGWLVHRTPLDKGETRFVLQTLRDQIGLHVWPVHRLDKGTSGVLVFALSAEVARLLGQAFESGDGLQKTYRAVVRGWPADEGLIDHALKRMPDDMRTERLEVQPAQSRFATLRRFELPLPQQGFASTRCAEVALTPLTGRRHQLRRHMKHIAHPIIGDATHGKGPLNRAVADLIGLQRLWLHAQSLELRHPVSGQQLRLESPLPSEWGLWNSFTEPSIQPPSGPSAAPSL
ncbi:pseudouridine synthase [Limnohabitans sp. 2KL-1]|uniref:pseudouridine synthase n=1 Tax=Limnohabitans sp. 2KL-1 TaxID=1100699 RepID=UPI000D35E0AC|nr:pseudouridine synthase [Limnohabitans sp. 2KL-1]PUE49361.1 pseudouridine synthase [Limnohabitans sp. 2KL-1]